MKRGKTERETCDLNGWGVGARLIGDEGYGPAIIRLTYFTENGDLLAVTESRNGEPVREREHFWTLDCREWSEVMCDDRNQHRPNRCCDFHQHVADGCCHCGDDR